MLTAIRKVPGGKFIRIFINIDRQHISSVKITGDFFLLPEEAIGTLEEALCNIPLPLNEDDLSHRIKFALAKTHLLGATPQDFIEILRDALATDPGITHNVAGKNTQEEGGRHA